MSKVSIDKSLITEMAEKIHLEIPESRLDTVAATTTDWYNNANGLAEKMMGDEYLELIPLSVIRFKD